LFSVVTLPAIYKLGRLLFDRKTALFATALLTVNAYHIRYAQEARSYALLMFLGTLSSLFFLGAIQKPFPRTFVFYVITSALAVYAHFYALLLIAAHWLAFRQLEASALAPELPQKFRRSWRAISIAVLPILIFVCKTGAGPIKWIHRPGLH